MSRDDVRPIGIRLPGSAGLVTGTAAVLGDLVHTIGTITLQQTTFSYYYVIRKIMWSNNTGGNGTLIFGTRERDAGFCATAADDHLRERV